MMTIAPKPLVLIILDGWGHREETAFNAIAAAKKPIWNKLMQRATHTLISGSGRCVGLPEGQMGNSEVGHLNMGTGRVIQQDLTRIDAAIEDQSFFHNHVLVNAIQEAKRNGKAVHVMGLLSPGGVHSHENQIQAIAQLAAMQQMNKVYFHAFLDGRDTPPQSAATSLQTLAKLCEQTQCGRVVSIIGRYYAMDRDKRWDRVQQAYDLLTQAKAEYHADNIDQALIDAYARNETDEFVKATTIGQAVSVEDGDVLLFMNFRADRAREITQAFIEKDFHGFQREKMPKLAHYICLTEYDKNFQAEVAFAPQSSANIFAEILSLAGLKQLRIAETEKYAHVTFFFNAGIEKPFAGEDRILIPSPKVATYDLQPEMSALAITDKLVEVIEQQSYEVIICNFANPDMVGHTGNFAATVQAIETIDECLGRILDAVQKVKGECLITADHGNAEMMFDPQTNQAHTAHTCDPVPFIYAGSRKMRICKQDGKLSDIAPTLLFLLGLTKPEEMTGNTLLVLE